MSLNIKKNAWCSHIYVHICGIVYVLALPLFKKEVYNIISIPPQANCVSIPENAASLYCISFKNLILKYAK